MSRFHIVLLEFFSLLASSFITGKTQIPSLFRSKLRPIVVPIPRHAEPSTTVSILDDQDVNRLFNHARYARHGPSPAYLTHYQIRLPCARTANRSNNNTLGWWSDIFSFVTGTITQSVGAVESLPIWIKGQDTKIMRQISTIATRWCTFFHIVSPSLSLLRLVCLWVSTDLSCMLHKPIPKRERK